MFTRLLRRERLFIGKMPSWLKISQTLGMSPLGEEVASNAMRLKGPRLMWGNTWYSRLAGKSTKPRWRRLLFNNLALFTLIWLGMMLAFAGPVIAQGFPSIKPSIVERAETPEDVTSTIELLLLLTVLTLAPSILIMTTAFTRIIVVFGFLRLALSTQQIPPGQVLSGLALILTFLVMRPTITEVKDKALVPYLDAEITQHEAFDRSLGSLRRFMFSQVAYDDMILFGSLSMQNESEDPDNWKVNDDVDTMVLIPAFVTSELKRGFYMGFMLYLPFLVIDLVVATVLISMGMLVLPPVMISLPFKILLFVLVDGWTLVVASVVTSFKGPGYG